MTAKVPRQEHVDGLRELLDLIESFPSNDQKARFLLSSNWMRDHGAEVASDAVARLAAARQCRPFG